MKVVDHQPHAWFLLQQGEELFLDVNCNHSAVGYSVLIRLSLEEVSAYVQEGHAYLDRLAEGVHHSGPGSAQQLIDISALHASKCAAALESWRKQQNSI